ncbi:hypothetical protein [Streptomyces sp. NPDC012510]|uniref:hypothetical protein n=1 Tax=Streptomyces sp. NPDC012510 TaxID=3364838 RepID=UPI0036E1D3F8
MLTTKAGRDTAASRGLFHLKLTAECFTETLGHDTGGSWPVTDRLFRNIRGHDAAET